MKCAIGHLSTWPLSRPLSEQRKTFDNDEIAPKPAVGTKRMIPLDVQAKFNAGQQGGAEHGFIPNWDTLPVSEAGSCIASGEMSSL